MYPDSRRDDENGAVTTSDRRSTMKTHQLLSGLIDDVGGIKKELRRWTEKWGTESSDTSNNVKVKILKCLRRHKQLSTKGNHCMNVGSPYITWANVVQHRDRTNKIIEECKEQRQWAAASGLGTRHKWVLGAYWSRKEASQKLRSLKKTLRIFDEVAELTGHGVVTTA